MCLSPIRKYDREKDTYYVYPCGKCIECVRKYQRDWAFRLEQEFLNWSHVYFLTLTYSDENLTYGCFGKRTDDLGFEESDESFDKLDKWIVKRIEKLPSTSFLGRLRHSDSDVYDYLRISSSHKYDLVPTVNKTDVQLWLKLVRETWFQKNHDRLRFKYFICSEYGPCTLRPHYHAVLFTNMDVFNFAQIFVEPWQRRYGNVHWKRDSLKWRTEDGVGSVMGYVAKYCSKPVYCENPYVVAGAVRKPFRLVSKGLGVSFFEKLSADVKAACTRFKYASDEYVAALDEKLHYYKQYVKDGVVHLLRMSVPRYYRDKLFPQKWFVHDRFDSRTKKFKTVWTRRKNPSSLLSQVYRAFVQERFLHESQQKVWSILMQGADFPDLVAFGEVEVALNKIRVEDSKDAIRRLCADYSKYLSYGY